MTESEKGAAKDYIELRINHFKSVVRILKDAYPIITAQPAKEFLDMGLKYNQTVISELEGVARHLKIELWKQEDLKK